MTKESKMAVAAMNAEIARLEGGGKLSPTAVILSYVREEAASVGYREGLAMLASGEALAMHWTIPAFTVSRKIVEVKP